MDIIAAKADAAARSLESKKLIFVNLGGDGEHEVADKQSKESLIAFKGGNEVSMPTLVEKSARASKPAKAKNAKASNKSSNKNKKDMAKTAKKGKAAPKKAAKKDTSGLIGKATTLLLSKEAWAKVDKAVEAGKGSIRELASAGIMKAL